MANGKAADESIFSLSFRGALPDILRAIADQIERQECKATNYQCQVSEDHFDLSLRVDLNPKG